MLAMKQHQKIEKNITSHDSYFLHIKNLENQYFLNVYLNMDYWTNNGYGMNGCGWKVLFFFGGISQLVDFSPKNEKIHENFVIFGFICHFRNENN